MKIKALLLLVAIPSSLWSVHGQETKVLLLTRTITLPAVRGGFNHMSVDTENRRLFAPAPTNKTLEVVDLRSGEPVRSLKGERPTAALYAPEFDQLYLSSGQNIYIYNAKTFETISRIDLHTRLDQLRYDARARELYVGCMSQRKTGIAVIVIPEGKLLRKIALPSSPQGIAVDTSGRRIFVNLPDLNSVAVLDPKEHKPIATWTLAGAGDNTPMALDEKDHRLFIACREPPVMLVLDTQSGRIIARVPCVADADDMWYDMAHKRIYVTGGGGFISVVEQQDVSRYRLLESATTARGAATSIFSAGLAALCVGVPGSKNEPAEIRVYKVEE